MTIRSASEYLQLISWDQLRELPTYKSLVSKAVLVEPIGELHAPTYGQCGLRDCKQPQKNSIIVALADGGVTNIGFDCGATHFPDRWEELKRRNTTVRQRSIAIRSLAGLQENLPAFKSEVGDLRRRLAAELACMKSFRETVPNDLLAELRRRAALGQSQIETFSSDGGETRSVLSHASANRIDGLNAFRGDKELCAMMQRAEEIVVHLAVKFDRLDVADKASLASLRKEISRQADYLPSLLQNIRESGPLVQRFFSQNNLNRLTRLDSAIKHNIGSFVLDVGTNSISITYKKNKRYDYAH
ncbi:MAG TPA: hypothetical protein VH082_03250 [Rudaea sp.]|jgi:hypothetical protein|nr:hypothetical protein [Rudaea sp.]